MLIWIVSTVLAFPCIAEDSRPNVLFIAIDDLNDWIGCMGGHPDTKTPNLDRLARQGVLFTNASTPSPACVPTRCAVMTGKAPATTGLYHNSDGHHRLYDDLKSLVTLPQYFSQQGYKSWGAGKLLHHFHHGDYDEVFDNGYWKNPEPEGVDCEKPPRTIEEFLDWWAPVDVPNSDMKDWQAAQWAAGVLQQEHEKPFFLACGIFRPHEPWNVPQAYYDKFPLDSLTLPKIKEDDLDDVGEPVKRPSPVAERIVSDEQVWRKSVQSYLANINFADDCLGLILDALDKSPHRDNTIIVLWSDHGWQLGEKYRWAKFTLWERSSRCVLMLAGPGITRGGRVSSPVSLQDIYPTLIDLCRLPARRSIDGRSFLPYLENPDKAPSDIPAITANELGFSLRGARYRYIRYHDGSEELYDHMKDPMEWNNLADDPDYAAVVTELKTHLPKNPAPRKRR
ncbi:sulfatase [Haloferula sp. A504]|uniref:sulfatase n=1 Tax=Haloferula sp. A504 TaxID=3373601 RepID=UPI0031CB997D|nr:sulfatase [Verrucomicrobiaceae bacterium E54]